MAGNMPRTASRAPGGSARTTTKTKATGTALPVVNPLDLWYLCEKAVYAKRNPYRRAKDNRPMYQRTVTTLVRADNELFEYHFPYCGEVGFDMTASPPKPLMSRKDKWRPSRFPLSFYSQISSKTLPGYTTLEIDRDLLGKDELEAAIALPLPDDVETRGVWTDIQGGMRGLLRIPDVLRLHSFTNPSTAQYSQPNLACVIEMKFPGDRLSERQQRAYENIAGLKSNFRLLETSRCELADKRLRRDWMRAAQKEPVYKPVSKPMSLPMRSMADPYQLLVGMIDAEHELARRRLEVRPPPPGTHVMSALPDAGEAEANRRQGVAQIEMTLAAPFVLVGTSILAIATSLEAGVAVVIEEATVAANAGAKVIHFDRYLRAARVARAATTAGVAATAADKLAAQPASVQQPTAAAASSEQYRQWDAYSAWDSQQQSQQQNERHYLFWPDAPGNTR
ncbi:hypothetical protein PSP6_50135 [Paraburkholderia tropica]|uniref:VRR-NUC domain-containing protein n=1 Tax=Paraburkholderia tropica TaxID=92647 RepID=UPI001CB5518D|nr:VRR-NUC domain-containing protein [Paraburkholderia tropica]CAG9226203.1 hypothetical protein PSP6_50135 [Paraburkholderia tropica]